LSKIKHTSLKLPVGKSPSKLKSIPKTMCEVLWRNISDIYVNLRVEVAAVSRNRYGVEKTVNTHKILNVLRWPCVLFIKYLNNGWCHRLSFNSTKNYCLTKIIYIRNNVQD
jgi:hypothetical protein